MKDFKKYRWFYTSSGVLVVGGKNAEQNDALLKEMQTLKKDFVVMHTSDPGSPFNVLMGERDALSPRDLEEGAIATGCFSRAWRERKKTASVDIFLISQLSKEKGMKAGMWRVKGAIQTVRVPLKLALVKQKGVLRAVPPATSSKALMTIIPGAPDKQTMAPQFEVELGNNINHDELMAALPAGGVKKA